MAGAPAYRYDYAASAQVAPAHSHPERQNPPLHVVRGRKSVSNPVISDISVVAVKAILVCMVLFLIFGFVQVGLASAAYSTASKASALRSEIADARSVGESLAVQKSLISSPNNVRATAQDSLGMAAPVSAATITLPADIVQTDAAGNLSFSQSIAQVAAQG